MLIMKNISKVFQTSDIQTHALRNFNLTVNEGDFVSVTGPSGSGNTTFLNIAGLLETFTAGEFLLDGEDVGKLNDNGRSRMITHPCEYPSGPGLQHQRCVLCCWWLEIVPQPVTGHTADLSRSGSSR